MVGVGEEQWKHEHFLFLTWGDWPLVSHVIWYLPSKKSLFCWSLVNHLTMNLNDLFLEQLSFPYAVFSSGLSRLASKGQECRSYHQTFYFQLCTNYLDKLLSCQQSNKLPYVTIIWRLGFCCKVFLPSILINCCTVSLSGSLSLLPISSCWFGAGA